MTRTAFSQFLTALVVQTILVSYLSEADETAQKAEECSCIACGALSHSFSSGVCGAVSATCAANAGAANDGCYTPGALSSCDCGSRVGTVKPENAEECSCIPCGASGHSFSKLVCGAAISTCSATAGAASDGCYTQAPFSGCDCGSRAGTVKPGATEDCADKPSVYMQKNNRVCAEWDGLTEEMCESTYWVKEKFCQQSCFDIGSGYEGDNCPVKVIELVCGDLQWIDCKAQSPECNWSDGECHDTVVCGDLKWSSCQAAGECNWKGDKKKCVVSCGDLKWSTCQPSDPHSNTCEWSGTCNSPVSGEHPGCQLITKRWQCNKALCNWTPMCMRKTTELCDNLRFRACKAHANCDWSGRKCWPVPDKDSVLGAEV